MANRFFSYIKTYIWTVILVIFILAFGAYTLKVFIDDHNREKSVAADTASRNEIVQQFMPSDAASQATPNTPKVSSNDLRGPSPAVLGSEVNEPSSDTSAPAPAEPALKPYRNEKLGFETMVPGEATVTSVANEVTATPAVGAAIYWKLTVYPDTMETLSSVETEMRGSPSVSRLARTTINGLPALQFSSPNLRGAQGFAFINNGRLYYLVGNFSDPVLLTSFKFF
jgi:hypothetical protein